MEHLYVKFGAASVFEISCRKNKTDIQTNGGKNTLANAISVCNYSSSSYYYLFIMLAAPPHLAVSIRPSVQSAHTRRDSPGGSTQSGQRSFGEP